PQKTADLLLPGTGVPISGDLAARWGWLHPGREWRNLGLSPDFPVTAEVASRMWAAKGNPAVDGVIAVDVVALKEILAAIGPVPGPNGDLSADNVEGF